ncbi:MBL fold metallo-hydrolase [Austwickia sp. TVS 96-490-7B]|uniref:MBL fold metallo-hydrolase n=1 Tax=Austwickia sp. TVS 96-490-7B TaxID=2830843 RepID=UPI001C57CB44|nr:MBL fold metallo-hydrolase [Austwickia sp. TVS 96-490-7B]
MTSNPVAATLTPTTEEVAPGVFAYIQPDGSWWVNNCAVVVGEHDALIVDTCATAERTRALLDMVGHIAPDQRLKYAVNTHLHGDHTYGNVLLPADTVLIGHERMRAGLAADPFICGCPPLWDSPLDWGVDGQRRLPDVAVGLNARVYVGDVEVELVHPARVAHTDGDLVVHVPQHRTLIAGDLVFNQVTPMVAMGSVTGALGSLDWLAGFGAHVIIPGHGPVLRGVDEITRCLADTRDYLQLVMQRALAGVRAKATPLQVAQDTDLGRFADWLDSERFVLNVHRAYTDLAGRPFDLLAAFDDAMTLHGGPLPTHV